MSATIPPLVCDTPPPIDELEDISGDEDISVEANGSHYGDETPSPSPSYHHQHANNSKFSIDSFTAVEEISSELNDMNSEFHDVESIEQTVLVENLFSSPSDIVNEMIGQKENDISESNPIYQIGSLDNTDISKDLTINCDDNVSNQKNFINSQNLQLKSTIDSDFDEQRRRIESGDLVNDETITTTIDNGGENLEKTVVDLDEYESTNNSLNGRIIHVDEQPACKIKLNEVLTKTIATVQSKKLNCDEKTLNEKFDADFSQFASFQKNRSVLSTTAITPDPIESFQNFEISTTSVHGEGTTHVFSNENTDNEDDEFGDFSSFSLSIIAASSFADMTTSIVHDKMNNSNSSSSLRDDSMNKSRTPPRLLKQKSTELRNANDSNDTFDSSSGEIITQKCQQVTITTNSSTNLELNADDRHPSNCKNTEYNLGAILSTLFPINMTNIDPDDDFNKYIKCSSINEQFQFMNGLTNNLINVENAKALKHQWSKSATKTFLVKSLGIDPRNILYGEKWNNLAPKFAANLGMSPLEPMKLNTTTSSDTSDNKSTFRTVAVVPAAQFDWNSSGLINPLDALHAHTLLLDLEQLVVVANLDKKHLNSSSSSTSKYMQEKDDDTECLANSVLKYQTTSTLKLSEIDTIDMVSPQSINSSSLIQQNGSNHRHIINDDGNRIKTNHSKFVNGMHSIIIDQSHKQQMVMGNPNRMTFDEYFRSRKSSHGERNEILLESPDHWNNECQKAQEPAINTASEMLKIISTISSPIIPEKESSRINKSDEPNAAFESSPNSNLESVQTSDSYNVPGSSGTMKETHIFTSIKSQPDTDVELSLDSNSVYKQLSPEDTERVVVIKENVVKKEYRDIEYDPERVISLDEFSDFQFVNTTATIAKEQVALELAQSPSFGFGSNAVLNDNSESNSAIVLTLSNCKGFEQTNALNTLHSVPVKQTTQVLKMHELKNENYNQIESLKRLDESMCVNNKNSQTDISVCVSADIQAITNQTYTDKHKLKSNAPTMMLSNILKPQLVLAEISSETSIKSPPNIEWPGPGIDTDQLMRIEERFYNQPQVKEAAKRSVEGNSLSVKVNNLSEKYSEDEEWSEFVSVDQPQTPITNILSKNLLKQQNDEDDWSEFVSSTAPISTKQTALNTLAPNYDISAANYSINTSYWNCGEMPNSMYNVSMNQRTSYMVPPHSEAPSMISTLPDLRFVAPTSLVHMPNSSLMKK